MKIQLLTTAVMLLLFTGCATTDDAKISAGKDLKNVSFENLQKQAAKGNADAQVALADRYRTGIGVEKSPIRAIQWTRKAANKGHDLAMLQLGLYHHRGLGGLEKSPLLARQWIRKSAEKGHPQAMANLAEMFTDGIGGEKNVSICPNTLA